MQKQKSKLLNLSNLSVEALSALEKVVAMSDELSYFFELTDKNFIAHEFPRRKTEQWIMADYLFTLSQKMEELNSLLNTILENREADAA